MLKLIINRIEESTKGEGEQESESEREGIITMTGGSVTSPKQSLDEKEENEKSKNTKTLVTTRDVNQRPRYVLG